MGMPKNLRLYPFPDPVGHFGATTILDFEGSVALQAVSKCLLSHEAGISSRKRLFAEIIVQLFWRIKTYLPELFQ